MKERQTYKDKLLDLDDEGATPVLKIDTEDVAVSYDPDAEEFKSAASPYRGCATLRELAESIVDDQDRAANTLNG